MPRAAKKAPAKKTAAKKAVKRTTAKKAVKRTTAKKKAVVAKQLKAITSKETKAQLIASIAEETELTKAQVKAVFESLGEHAERHLMKRGSGELTIPNLGVKVRRVRKKATKARMGRNPFTGEEVKIAAKPARNVVKVTALKGLKEMIAE